MDKRERVLDPMTAYQITSMMEGVVQRGTATVVKEVGKPIAGKTGTTNDEKDAWFIGFSPDLVVGVYLGYDKPRHLGKRRHRRRARGPDRPGFHEGRARRQAGGAVSRAGRHQAHSHRSEDRNARGPGDQRVILEAFKPGTAPPDNYSVIGVTDADGRPLGVSPEATGRSATERRALLSVRSCAASLAICSGLHAARSTPRLGRQLCGSAARPNPLHRQPTCAIDGHDRPCARKSQNIVDEIKQSVGLLRRHL